MIKLNDLSVDGANSTSEIFEGYLHVAPLEILESVFVFLEPSLVLVAIYTKNICNRYLPVRELEIVLILGFNPKTISPHRRFFLRPAADHIPN